jgi:DNA-binding transcriptional LysR family regulator
LIDKGVDMAIRISPVADSSAIARQIGSLRWILCASPDYLSAHGRPEAPDDLVQHNCLVHLKSAPDSVWTFTRAGREFHVPVTGTFSANSSLALRAPAVKGFGIALLPFYSISSDLASGRLLEVLPDFQGPERPITALYQHRPLLLRKVQLLVDYLAERFKQAPISFADHERQKDSQADFGRRSRRDGPKNVGPYRNVRQSKCRPLPAV